MAGYCVDLSHHQDPAAVPWERFRGTVDAIICRASYGAELRDRRVVEHMRRAREVGCRVGLYQFFRPSQSVAAHLETLRAVADAVQLREGDIVPALDVELDPLPTKTPVAPSWEPFVRELAEGIRDTWGDCMIYITRREWTQLGSPAWVTERPLWVAHYTLAATPASPGDVQPVMWQHRVGPFDPHGPGGYDAAHPDLDQSRILRPLPLIGGVAHPELSDEDRARVAGLVALTLDDTIRGDDESRRFRYA